MKRLVVIIAALVIFLSPSSARADSGWVIDSFASAIAIQSDGHLLVKETIDARFTESKHGIFRYIPNIYKTETAADKEFTISVQGVERDGAAEPYVESQEGVHLFIKIGDGDKTITGPHRYTITYDVVGALLAFSTYDELYWNVTGNQWEVPMGKASTTVTLPTGVVEQASCYVGPEGSREQCAVAGVGTAAFSAESGRALAAGEGLTVAVGYPKGSVPILVGQAGYDGIFSLVDARVAVPAFGISLLLLLALAWLLSRRSNGIWELFQRQVIAPEFDVPEGLRPAELSLLIRKRTRTTDVTATIVDLAVRGYLQIVEVPAVKKLFGGSALDYNLVRLKKSWDGADLRSYEHKLLTALFADAETVALADLKGEFYKSSKVVQDTLKEESAKAGWFTAKPGNQSRTMLVLGILLFVAGHIGVIFAAVAHSAVGVGFGGALYTFAILLWVTMAFATKYTDAGRALAARAKGYKLFLSSVEKYRQPFFERQNIFMTVLPYAIALGITKKLAAAFAALGYDPDMGHQGSWYVSTAPLNLVLLTNNLNTFGMSMNVAAMAPSSSGSGGGGFSGGGGGGGGGGSW